MFIMVDGIDGSGKSTAVNTWKEKLTAEGNGVFDLKKYWQETGRYPEFSELKAYDFIFSSEPTEVGLGRVIRDELIRRGAGYSSLAIAEAYSLDRLVLYTKIIIPALKNGKCVIQDRGITTSIAYQPLTDKKLTRALLSKLPGNALALKYRPDKIVLAIIKPQEALNRLSNRLDKKDNAIFERLDFQTRAAKVFNSKSYQTFFTKLGSCFYQLHGGAKIDIMKQEANNLLPSLLNDNQ